MSHDDHGSVHAEHVSTTHTGPSSDRTPNSDRYELGDIFGDMEPETELVFTTIGIVLVLVVLGVLLYYPVLLSRGH
jgi:hypothetical protein